MLLKLQLPLKNTIALKKYNYHYKYNCNATTIAPKNTIATTTKIYHF